MNEPPYIGCAITIVDPGPVRQPRNAIYTPRRNRNGEPRVMKVYVTRVKQSISKDCACFIYWHAGSRIGEVRLEDEGIEWVRGRGPMARASLLAARKLVESG